MAFLSAAARFLLPALLFAGVFRRWGLWPGLPAAAALYAAVTFGVWLAQDRLLFRRPRRLLATPADFSLPFTELRLVPAGAAPGEFVHAWHIPPPGADAPTVLYCHGIAHNISHRLEIAALYRRAGCGILLFDYRGFGRSPGRPSEAATCADARCAWEHLARDLPPERLVVHGHSLGSGVAAWLAATVFPAEGAPEKLPRLVLEAAFTDMPAMAQRVLPWLPVRFLCHTRYPNRARLARVRCPALFIHSREDGLVPYAMGEALFAAYPGPREFLTTRGDHDRSLIQDAERALPVLRRFCAGGPPADDATSGESGG